MTPRAESSWPRIGLCRSQRAACKHSSRGTHSVALCQLECFACSTTLDSSAGPPGPVLVATSGPPPPRLRPHPSPTRQPRVGAAPPRRRLRMSVRATSGVRTHVPSRPALVLPQQHSAFRLHVAGGPNFCLQPGSVRTRTRHPPVYSRISTPRVTQFTGAPVFRIQGVPLSAAAARAWPDSVPVVPHGSVLA
jgi:hypothetical protein